MKQRRTKSIKELQSELGATGEAGPNVVLVEKLCTELHNNFEHVHFSNTNNDAFLFISQVAVGHVHRNEETLVMGVIAGQRGCDADIELMLTTYLDRVPRLIPILQSAILGAVQMQLKRAGIIDNGE